MSGERKDRVIGERRAIDYGATLKFFDERARRSGEVGFLSTVLYQDKNPALAAARDQEELQRALPHFPLGDSTRALDLGCGVGRWAHHLAGKIGSYLGVDFSAQLIEIAERAWHDRAGSDRFKFQALSATMVSAETISIKPPFDLFIAAGLMIYLNDDDCLKLLRQLPKLAAPGATLYLREPTGVRERLTLDRHFSQELAAEYNAIYRTFDEYQALFAESLLPAGFALEATYNPLDEQLRNRSDTTQTAMIFRGPR